jgi:hypothetical protein
VGIYITCHNPLYRLKSNGIRQERVKFTCNVCSNLTRTPRQLHRELSQYVHFSVTTTCHICAEAHMKYVRLPINRQYRYGAGLVNSRML